MVKSPRNPVVSPAGFFPWFSTRRGTKSGHTTPFEMRTSEVIGAPLLMAVIKSTVGASPRFAQSGTHAAAVVPASSRMIAFALILSSLRES
jgi:hypothetical protein